MGRRGDELREHMLWAATEVFLEVGFERASMDVIAARAETTKRTLYSHFESKENLFFAVIELVRGLVLNRLKYPQDYSQDPIEAVTLFCARYIEILRYEPAVQMCRVSISEAARFPQGAAQHFDALFTEAHSRLSNFLQKTLGLTDSIGDETAWKLLGQLLYPGLLRSLFGVNELAKSYNPDEKVFDVDLPPIRKAVEDMFESLPKR
ncbi:TetR/AcrR family transcriptional regulator [bacterium]|nr:MAG: TetR/AcrR family transcriptional regulator [bacterium]